MSETEIFDQIAFAFLDRWQIETQVNAVKMHQYDDRQSRYALATNDPSEANTVEKHTRHEIQKGLENVALANAVTAAILKAHQILPSAK